MAADQTMKPATAAKKLEIYLPATPEEFRTGVVTRSELERLQSDPPAWLVELRRDGPHPRHVTANRLGVSASGLARAGVSDAMTTAEIDAIREELPEWLVAERATLRRVREDERRAAETARD